MGRGNAQVDTWNLINALALIAAVVYPLRQANRSLRPVHIVRPCFAPQFHISFIVPVRGIFPVVLPAAFAVRDTLAALVQIVDLATLGSPLAVFFQRAHGKQDMDMGIAGAFVMQGKIGAHPFVHKVVLNKRADKG